MKALILGNGYTTNHLKNIIDCEEIFITSRNGAPHIEFDLQNESTWSNIIKVDYTFWTFPAQPLDLVEKFVNQYREKLGKIIIIGSTGSYIVDNENQNIDESSPLDFKSERVLGEEFIRKNEGVVVRASGIYGPDRNPLNWVQSGRVGPSNKLLNLIHVSDLSKILWRAATSPLKAENFIATSKEPMRWDHLIEKLSESFEFDVQKNAPPSKRSSKFLNGDLTLEKLGIELSHPFIVEGIKEVNRS